MAVRGVDEKEEKKSYGSVFLLGSALLVVVTLWSFWDDNFSRRPWKAVQAGFYRLDYNKVEAAKQKRDQLKEEIKKLGSGLKELEDQYAKVTADREKWQGVMQNAVLFKLGPLPVYKIPNIRQVALNEFDRNNFDQPVARVDRCQTCHTAINRAGFENEKNPFKTHPRREVLLADNAHPPEKFGCTSCHGGQGAAVNSVKQAHGEVEFWEHPLLRGAKVQSSCTSCHLNVQSLEDAPMVAQGQRIFEQIGCTGCHLVKGYEDIPKIGPSLKRISAKVDPSWMVRWVENPHKFRPRTRMPNFDFKPDEAVAISAYLWSLSKDEGQKWLDEHPPPAGPRAGLAPPGKALVEFIRGESSPRLRQGGVVDTGGKARELVGELKVNHGGN